MFFGVFWCFLFLLRGQNVVFTHNLQKREVFAGFLIKKGGRAKCFTRPEFYKYMILNRCFVGNLDHIKVKSFCHIERLENIVVYKGAVFIAYDPVADTFA